MTDPTASRPQMPGYGISESLEGESMFVLRPRVAFAFIETADQFATAATRWRFE